MIALVVTIHIVVCLTLIGVVLLQQGKGADVGAVFGGSSQTVFGASGAGNLLTKVTGVCAAIFFSTSLILAYYSSHRTSGSIFSGRRPSRIVQPASTGTPGGPALPSGTSLPASHAAPPAPVSHK